MRREFNVGSDIPVTIWVDLPDGSSTVTYQYFLVLICEAAQKREREAEQKLLVEE